MFYLAMIRDLEGRIKHIKITEDVQSAYFFLQAPFFYMTETELEEYFKKEDNFDERIERISKKIEKYNEWTYINPIIQYTSSIIVLDASLEPIKDELANITKNKNL